jgi:hypothetical protein
MLRLCNSQVVIHFSFVPRITQKNSEMEFKFILEVMVKTTGNLTSLKYTYYLNIEGMTLLICPAHLFCAGEHDVWVPR